MQQSGGRPPEFNLDKIMLQLAAVIQRFASRQGRSALSTLTLAVLAVAAIGWLATGVYSVSPGEEAIIRVFGKASSTTGPGLHWNWPAPIGTRNVESMQQIRTMELGFASGDRGSFPVSGEALMITGDLNIVDVQLVVQYRIKNLQEFLFRVDDPGELARGLPPGRPEGRTLKDATEAALRLVVGQRSVDGVLVSEREHLQSDTQVLLQDILDSYSAGIQIVTVRLQEVKPPDEVRDAFDDVLRARQDQDTRVNEAKAYREDILPRAAGEAAQMINIAEAFKAERVAKAEGEAQRFLSVLAEYRKAKEVTRHRLYLEAMEEILPDITKFIVSADAGGNLLQFLPIGTSQPFPPPSSASQPFPTPSSTPSP